MASREADLREMLASCKEFKAALALDPSRTEIHHAWGNTLFALGEATLEHHYFQDALEHYKRALELAEKEQYDAYSDLYWDYAAACMRIADHSGEAVDCHAALDAFHTASTLQGQFPPEFWNDYGLAALTLAKQISDVRLTVKAMSCFREALSLNKEYFDGWTNMARALVWFYAYSHDEDHFSQASECFSTATNLRPQDVDLWLEWARSLLDSGRQNRDIKRLKSAIEKCHRAYVCDPDSALTSALWAEALALLGELCDRLDLLCEAQNKIEAAAEMEGDCPEILYSHGMCLISLARYFDDYDHYFQAIEKFQSGLSIDRSCGKIWHAIGTCYTEVAELDNDADAYKKALRFYSKALDLISCTYILVDYATALFRLGEIIDEPSLLEQAQQQFELAFSLQKNALYLHPDWLFDYACLLDLLGDIGEEEPYYSRAIEIFSHVLMIDPDFPDIHHRLGQAFSHAGDITGEKEQFYRSLHHLRLALKRDEEDDQILLDIAICLVNIAERSLDAQEADELYREAEHKLTQAAKHGSTQAYYQLSCLYSILGQYDKAMRFLKRSEEFRALPSLDELLCDDWLEGVRGTSDFQAYLTHLERRL